MRGATTVLQTPAIQLLCFNPRPSCEGRPSGSRHIHILLPFQSTPLLRGATPSLHTTVKGAAVSIHAPLARGDDKAERYRAIQAGFNPRPSCEGRRYCGMSKGAERRFNPRPSCEGRHVARSQKKGERRFNPRPSCEGRRLTRQQPLRKSLFQSTPLLRGATGFDDGYYRVILFQSTPLLRGATHGSSLSKRYPKVSIHAPLARGDFEEIERLQDDDLFQSTPLLRGATKSGDCLWSIAKFQSTPLLRGATEVTNQVTVSTQFQSTPLLRGATCCCNENKT